MEINSEKILEGMLSFAKAYEYKPPFPEIGDWHTSNAVAFFGRDKVYKAYKEDKYAFKNNYRARSKSIGLGLCYGGSAKMIARSLGVSEQEAKDLYDSFFKQLSGFARHLKQEITKAKKNLFIKNAFGRIIYTPQLGNSDWKEVAKGMRLVYNYPIQSVSADLVKLIFLDVFALVEQAETDRFAGDLVLKDYYQRIVSISEDKVVDIEPELELMETGNVLVIVKNAQGEIVSEWDKPLKLSVQDIERLGMTLEF